MVVTSIKLRVLTQEILMLCEEFFSHSGFKNLWFKRSYAVGLWSIFLFKQMFIKSFKCRFNSSGIKGISSLRPICIMAAIGLSKSYYIHGIFAVAISRIVQPKDQISALYV